MLQTLAARLLVLDVACGGFRVGMFLSRLLNEFWEKEIRPDLLEIGVDCDWDHESIFVINLDKARQVWRETETSLQLGPLYDYHVLMDTVVNQCVRALQKLCPCLTDIALEQIQVRPTVPFEEEWSLPFDIAFETQGTTIAFPDAKTFSPRVAEYAASQLPHKARLLFCFWNRCFRAACHEIFHCVQNLIGQTDSSTSSWVAEHDASFLSASLLAYALRDEAKLLGILLAQWEAEIVHLHALVPREIKLGYTQWRDSFGRVAPWDPSVLSGHGLYVKDRLAFEALTFNEDQFKTQLSLILEDRKGDISKIPPKCLLMEYPVSSDSGENLIFPRL
jgi:hypothetical protein